MAIITCEQCGARNRVDPQAASQRKPVCGNCRAELSIDATQEQPPSDHPIVVSDASFASAVLGRKKVPVLLDCWAPWCGPCRMVGPMLDQMAQESNGRYVIAKLNVDENPATSVRFGIKSIPTLLIFKNGVLVDRIVGAQSKQAITTMLNKHLT